MEKKIKVLIIDDSAFMRRVISDIIESSNKCVVIGKASNGKEGLEKIKQLKPDVVTLDVEMPIMNGIEMLKTLGKENILPIIMLSTLTFEGATETIKALELGAYDFIKKPDNIFKVDSAKIKNALIEKIVSASRVSSKALSYYKPIVSPNRRNVANKDFRDNRVNNLVAIGTSTGGPKALQYVLPYLPGNIDGGIVVVQHMPAGFTKSLAGRLDQLSDIKVKEAEDNEMIENGTAYIAPGDKHLLVKKKNNRFYILLSDEKPVAGLKPSVDVMMNSLSTIKELKLTGVIMTGMGSDGTKGIKNILEKREMHVISQNEESCVVYGMPKAVVNAKLSNEIVELNSIAKSIIKQTGVL